MSTAILEVQGLGKQYPKVTALGGVTLSIEQGEIFALLGPNGAGKTTLIGAVCGLVKKTSGTIKLFGQDVELDPVKPRYEIGLVPQEINFDPFFTAREALHIQLGYYGRPRDEARVEEVLKALNLLEKADAQTRQLSGGMKRRLLIAKALVHKPKLVFLDEPTAGVDVELRRDLWNYVRRLRDEGTTIVLTTHYLEEAEELADRVGIIDHGKLLLVEEKSALMKRMGERQLIVRFSTRCELPQALVTLGAKLNAEGTELQYTEKTGQLAAGDVLKVVYAAGMPVQDVETRKARLEDILIQVLHSQKLSA